MYVALITVAIKEIALISVTYSLGQSYELNGGRSQRGNMMEEEDEHSFDKPYSFRNNGCAITISIFGHFMSIMEDKVMCMQMTIPSSQSYRNIYIMYTFVVWMMSSSYVIRLYFDLALQVVKSLTRIGSEIDTLVQTHGFDLELLDSTRPIATKRTQIGPNKCVI